MKTKIGIGLIVKDFTNASPLVDFIRNGIQYEKAPQVAIIAYSGKVSLEAVREVEAYVTVKLIDVFSYNELWERLREDGLTVEEQAVLLSGPREKEQGVVPYGKNRNQVLIMAMTLGLDSLFFIDYDVWPSHLRRVEGSVVLEAVNFFGGHLQYLEIPEVMATTSDYTGYYIVPKLPIENANRLLRGLQKSDFMGFLAVDEGDVGGTVVQTSKVLGGNLGLKLKAFERLLPFFSSSYEFEGRRYLTRGEDTLLTLQIGRSEEWVCLDVDLRIFHDAFGHYPKEPDILLETPIRDRFFFACMGWIGRNPFLNWLSGEDPKVCATTLREDLQEGAKTLAQALSDERFLKLPEAMGSALESLPQMIEEYRAFSSAWTKWTQLRRGRL